MNTEDPLTPSQTRKLQYIAKVGETKNPGDLTTTYSLVTRGLVEARQGGKMPHPYMTYRVTDKGREALAQVTS
jgi:predicted ArsR family transcriptional regulator